MQSQQCQKCAAGTYSLGTGVAFDEWDSLPSGFVTHGVNTNDGDTHTDCSKLVHASLVLILKAGLFFMCVGSIDKSKLSLFLSFEKLIKLLMFLQLNLDTKW